ETATVPLRVESFITTSECPKAEKPSPPYFLGMIMPRKPLSFMYCQTLGGRSRSSCVTYQSLTIRHSSSTGPSRKAFSSADSVGFGYASSFFQSGLPLKSSASHHTVPASIASRSVCDNCDSTLLEMRKTG